MDLDSTRLRLLGVELGFGGWSVRTKALRLTQRTLNETVFIG
jgi:hypothetical protein